MKRNHLITPCLTVAMSFVAIFTFAQEPVELEHAHGETCTHDQATKTTSARSVLDVPEPAQHLLGISFVIAEQRSLQATRRFPGCFELLPDAQRQYSVPLAGQIELHVQPLQQVKPGTLLFTLHAPEWLQQAGAAQMAQAEVAVVRSECEALRKRLTALQIAGSKNAELEMTLVVKEAELLRALCAERNAESTSKALRTLCREENGVLRFDALTSGCVEQLSVSSGAWVNPGDAVLSVTREKRLWFKAEGLPSEMDLVRDGQSGVVGPTRGMGEPSSELAGVIKLGVRGDPVTRRHPLYLIPQESQADSHPTLPVWAASGRPGILSVTVLKSDSDPIVLPVGCLVTDGLKRLVFVRDPDDPNRLFACEVTTGTRAGEWIEVSGIEVGSAVVLDGAHELKLALPATETPRRTAGHFHADGLFHDGAH